MVEHGEEPPDLRLVKAPLPRQGSSPGRRVPSPARAPGVAHVVEHRGDPEVAEGAGRQAQGLAEEQGQIRDGHEVALTRAQEAAAQGSDRREGQAGRTGRRPSP